MTSKAIFGRYHSAASPVHGLDPRTKLVGVLVVVVALFVAANWPATGFMAAVIAAMFAVSRIPPLQALRSVAPILFVAAFAALFNVLFLQGGEVYLDVGWLKVTSEGVDRGLFVGCRLVLLLLLGSLLTMTTTSIDVTEATERLLSPFARVGLPAHEFAFVMGTALRFLPQFSDEFQSIRAAQLARGARLSTSPVRGMAALSSMVVPLFASVFRHADTLSAAMEARCYHGAEGRTRLRPLRFARADAVAGAILAATVVAAAALSRL